MSITTWGEAVDYTFQTRPAWRKGAGSQAAQINTNHFTRLRGLSFPVSKINNAIVSQVAIELEDEGKADGTINRIISAISCVLNHCAFDRLIEEPSKFRRRTEGESRSLFFTKEQVIRLAASAEDPFQREDLKDAINFAAYTGMRRGEIIKLKAKDVDLSNGIIHIGGRSDVQTKAKNYRTVPIHTHLIEMLAKRTDQVGKNVAIFGDQWGNPTELSRAFNKVRNFLDFDEGYVFHVLRHSFATWHVEAQTPFITLKNLMGHKRIETTLRYAKVTNKAALSAMSNI